MYCMLVNVKLMLLVILIYSFNYSKEARGGGGARTIIEGVASTGWVSDARVETTTHFYTSRLW